MLDQYVQFIWGWNRLYPDGSFLPDHRRSGSEKVVLLFQSYRHEFNFRLFVRSFRGCRFIGQICSGVVSDNLRRQSGDHTSHRVPGPGVGAALFYVYKEDFHKGMIILHCKAGWSKYSGQR